MESKYKIDRDYLRLLYSGMDDQKNTCFDKDMVLIENLLYRLENNFQKFDYGYTDIELLKEDLQVLYKYRPLYEYVKTLLKSTKLFDDGMEITYTKKKISDDESIDIASSFFREQGDFFYKPLSEFLEDKYDRIEFIEPSDNTDGEMVFLSTMDEAFLISTNYEDIRKVTILIHELEHVIDCFNNNCFFENSIIREVATLFMEMIGSNYTSKVLNLDKDGDMRRYHQRYCVLTAADFCYEKKQLLERYKRFTNLDNENLHKKLIRDGISDNYLNYLLSTNITEDYYYQIAYLIAQEIYMIYIQDKKCGLLILRDIIMNGNDYNIYNILNKYGIVLNKSNKEYEEGLYLKLKV